jgi:pimeloyl-ACP methyl ester carboxylesterase
LSTFVLVHGAYLGAWCFEPLTAVLNKLGHKSITFDLPLQEPQAGALRYAEVALQAIENAFKVDDSLHNSELIFVGHSMSGMVIPAMHESMPASQLVFLTAALPKPGQCFMERARGVESDVFLTTGQVNPYNDVDLAKKYWFHDCPEDIANWAAPLMRQQLSAKILSEKCVFKQFADIKMTSIVGMKERLLNPQWSIRLSRELFGVDPIEMPCGHCPQVTHPEHLGAILDSLTLKNEQKTR